MRLFQKRKKVFYLFFLRFSHVRYSLSASLRAFAASRRLARSSPLPLRLAAGFRPIVSGKRRKLPASSHFLRLPETARLIAIQIRHIGHSFEWCGCPTTPASLPRTSPVSVPKLLAHPIHENRYSSAVLVFYLQKIFRSPFPVKFRQKPAFICKKSFNDLLCFRLLSGAIK